MACAQEPERIAYARVKLLAAAAALAIALAAALALCVAAVHLPDGAARATTPTLPPTASPAGADLNTTLLTRQQTPPPAPTEYRWVDRSAGLVAIPVEVAMDLYLARTTEAEAP